MINKVTLVGNVGKDPDINYIQPDVPLGKFPLATDESFKKNDGNWENRTEWHNIVAWRNTAKYVENNIKKGMMIYIEGKIQTRKYQDNQGIDKYITQIVANNIKILNKRDYDKGGQSGGYQDNPGYNSAPEQNSGQQNEQSNNNENKDPFANEEQADDDLPF